MRTTYVRPYESIDGDAMQFEYGLLAEGVKLNAASRFEMLGVANSFDEAQAALAAYVERTIRGVPSDDEVNLLMNEVSGFIEQRLIRLGYIDHHSTAGKVTEDVAARVAKAILAAHERGEVTY